MGKTNIGISGRKFLLNGALTYADIPDSNHASHGLLWNQRLIQGVFDDKGNRARYNQLLALAFDPERHTDDLIASLPTWYAYGLRAITVGFQGGWPVSMLGAEELNNNPFGEDGKTLDTAYAARMDRIIRAADAIGMVVIVNILYWAQAKKLKDGLAIVNAVKTASAFLREGGYTNVMVDVANEYNIHLFADHVIANTDEGMAQLIRIAKEATGGMPVASSNAGGPIHREVIRESDFVLIHGNGMTRGQYYAYMKQIMELAGDKPVLCNEDSPCFTRVDVSLELGGSWGYYNNYTKQIPPCPWDITEGEDLFFARRIARAVGISVEPLPMEKQLYLQGFESWNTFGNGMRVARLAAEYPEQVDFVRFYRDDTLVYTAYDEPFFCFYETTWLATPFIQVEGERWHAVVRMGDGTEHTIHPTL